MAQKNEFVKCRSTHCKHPDEPLRREDAYKVGSAYYHKDCFMEKELLRKIEKYFIDNFDKQPIMQALRKVINTIVYTQGNSPELLMYALRYAKENNIALRHPAGIYYVMKNTKMLESWHKYLNKKKVDFDFGEVEDLKSVVGYNNSRQTNGFGRIHRGKRAEAGVFLDDAIV